MEKKSDLDFVLIYDHQKVLVDLDLRNEPSRKDNIEKVLMNFILFIIYHFDLCFGIVSQF